MAGGMILLGILLVFYDVPSAMMLFGIVQLSSNGTRALLWHSFIQWKIVFFYVCGVIIAFIAISFIAFIPPAFLIYILLGVIPFLTLLMPKKFSPSIVTKRGAICAGIVIMIFQAIAGSAGTMIDAFFQKSPFNRKTIIATKATLSSINQVIRTIYYFLSASLTFSTLEIYIWGIATAIGGTMMSGMVLSRMSDESFSKYSKYIIYFISSTYITYGFYCFIRKFYQINLSLYR